MVLGVQVEHVRRQRPVQPRHRATHDVKTRPRKRGARLKIQTQGLAQGHVVLRWPGQWRGVGTGTTGGRPASHFDIGGFVGTHGHLRMRQIGHGKQGLVHGLLQTRQIVRGLLELGLELAHLGHGGLNRLALGFALANVARQGVALCLPLLGAHLQVFALGLHGLKGGHVNKGLGLAPRLEPLHHVVKVFAQQLNVQHGG